MSFSKLLPLSEIPTLTALYASRKLTPTASSVKPSKKYNDIICTLQHDITKLEVDAIVNAANKRLLGGGGVDGAIHRAAGPGLLEECKKFGGCATGSAEITGGYDLPCKKVIHAVGPVYESQEESEPLLRSCYRTSLKLAADNDCKSIAFSALSTGIYGYPAYAAAEAVLREIRQCFQQFPWMKKIEKIIFCSFADQDVEAYAIQLPKKFPAVPEAEQEKPKEAEASQEVAGSEAEEDKPREEESLQEVAAPEVGTITSDTTTDAVTRTSDTATDASISQPNPNPPTTISSETSAGRLAELPDASQTVNEGWEAAEPTQDRKDVRKVVDSDGRTGIKFSQAEKSALAAKSESEPASQTQTLVQRPHRRDVYEVVEGGRVMVDFAEEAAEKDTLPAMQALQHATSQKTHQAGEDARSNAMQQTEMNEMKTKMQAEINDMMNGIKAVETKINALETESRAMKAAKDVAESRLAVLQAKVSEMEEKLTANRTDKEVPNVPAVIEHYRKRILVLEAYLRDKH